MIAFIIGLIAGTFIGVFTMCMLFLSGEDEQTERRFADKINCRYADEYYCLDNCDCNHKPEMCEWSVIKE